MASSSNNNTNVENITNKVATVALDDEEIEVEDMDFHEEQSVTKYDLQFALVGRFLTEHFIRLNEMSQVMAANWRPAQGDNLDKVDLNELAMWIQLHDLPAGWCSDSIARKIGSRLGEFLESDPNNHLGARKDYMRIRIKFDVLKPLKKMINLKKPKGEGHGEKFRRLNYATEEGAAPVMLTIEDGKAKISPPSGDDMDCGGNRENSNVGSDGEQKGAITIRGPHEDGNGKKVEPTFAPQTTKFTASQIVNKLPESIFFEEVDVTGVEPKRKRVGLTQEAHSTNDPMEGPPRAMSCLSWNCRGLGGLKTVRLLTDLVREKKPEVIFLIETFCTSARISEIANKLNYEGSYGVDCRGHSAGLGLIWRCNDKVTILGSHDRYIDATVTLENQRMFRLTGFYGDFNELMHQSEKRGNHPHPGSLIEAFRQAVTDCGLSDLGYVGYVYTWEKGRGTTRWVEERLDRALVSTGWKHLFNQSHLIHLSVSTSDHLPVLLELRKFVPRQSLRRFKKDLEDWGKRLRLKWKSRIKELKNQIEVLKWAGASGDVALLNHAEYELNLVLRQEEEYWKQRAKLFWLKAGDSNSRAFHLATSKRRSRNAIANLRGEDGQMPFAVEKVKDALFAMHPDKSPGDDGFSPGFYQRHWEIVGEDVANACIGWLNDDSILIAHEVLHFLKRKREGRIGYAALKIDISKAYDKLEWNYLFVVLEVMGFSSKWLEWMRMCVCTVSYKVVFGGELLGPIYPTRGLRQGDPLSPYLFILAAEGLSALLKQGERCGVLHGCSVARGAPTVSHLFFVDDSYLFFKATESESRSLKQILLRYQNLSSQEINLNKSALIFSRNTDDVVKRGICSILQVEEQVDPGIYLGMPTVVGKNKQQLFEFVRRKVWNIIQNWNGRRLSRAGKEICLKTVAQSIPTYVMQLLLLPKDLCRILSL
ncbi:putative mitochondrial protein [Vitis vinifera]|uniref:Putative mitochondrial protein n=1 Tax=Vitis vinifera TaxID=29760 RepID=A0A438JFE7_VITVI|nr:putative mitochondrial protein [Vitis vinifera]